MFFPNIRCKIKDKSFAKCAHLTKLLGSPLNVERIKANIDIAARLKPTSFFLDLGSRA
jgi:hypothetical protein